LDKIVHKNFPQRSFCDKVVIVPDKLCFLYALRMVNKKADKRLTSIAFAQILLKNITKTY